jgi:predicted transcriptional regulator
MKVLDEKQAEQAIEYLCHAAYLLDPHPRLNAQQLLQEMTRARSTVQHVLDMLQAAVLAAKAAEPSSEVSQ